MVIPKIKPYSCRLTVRGYELDSFGHTNHAVYINYCEHARWQMLEEDGITLKKFEQMGAFPIIAALECEYLKPTYLGDALEAVSEVVAQGKSNFEVEHSIQKGGKPVFRARVRVVMVNKAGRPTAIPDEILNIWKVRGA